MAKDFEEELDQLVERPLENHDAENLRKDSLPTGRRTSPSCDTKMSIRTTTARKSFASLRGDAKNHLRKQLGHWRSQSRTLMTLVETAKLHKADGLQLMLALRAE